MNLIATITTRLRINLLALSTLLLTHSAFAISEEDLLALLATENHFAMMRHTLAPGTGDPASFSLRNCTTQRNLNDEGKAQARETGAFFFAQGIEFHRVYSSQWCRCLDTATLLNHGPVLELPQLNSFFQTMGLAQERTQHLREWLATQTINKPILLVTHQVNISALTGLFTSSGELVVLELGSDGEIIVKGKIDPR